MEIRHTLELGAKNPIPQMIKFSSRKIERWIDCESCEGHRFSLVIKNRKGVENSNYWIDWRFGDING